MQLLNVWLILGPALVLAIISGYLSERVGIVNIAINGMMTFGALFFMMFSIIFKNVIGNDGSSYQWTFLASFLISSLLSTLVGILFAFATVKLKADHVIAGTGINLLATGIGLVINDRAMPLFKIPTLSNQYNPKTNLGINPGNDLRLESLICFLIGILVIAIIYIVMNYTKLGLRYRSCGENPNAADAQGLNVYKYQWLGLMFVGFIAGLSGSFFAFSISGQGFTGDVDGLGFMALALMIVSSWKILPSIFLGLIFALLLTYTKQANLPNISDGFLLKMIPFILTLLVMVLFGRFIKGPKAAGTHFDKGLR
ncbi:ABC transporter permease [Mycoplasmoides pirum]|uniref:ABC transporter permease n=1 Tax=Mycoplasmoides pirum TaxID=2122 RepID=UPI00048551D3|nr:ABC transporter permease [Mycoplasmoides pirum]